jgi:FAD:protein FMN transferase
LSVRLGWVERAQPLLGTLVSIGLCGPDDADSHALLDSAFAEVAEIHRLMSFHDPASDVSRLNRSTQAPTCVDPRTVEVLRIALALSAATDGVFDISIAPELVRAGALPMPLDAPAADPCANWRDIEILGTDQLIFHRPLWIDLGGIAKGYAVDRACECLGSGVDTLVRVNAGGDLRVAGPYVERVWLRQPAAATTTATATQPMLELSQGSVASSATSPATSGTDPRIACLHYDGRQRRAAAPDQFVSVVTERCLIADALTKVVLAVGTDAQELLAQHGATAHLHTAAAGWCTLGAIGTLTAI